MAYNSQITYETKDLNSSLFLDVLREVLQVEMLNQKTTYAKSYLPSKVSPDDYLTNPTAEKELNPSWCSIIKAKWESSDNQFQQQQNNMCYYVIGILAPGLSELKMIADCFYRIMNDMSVKHYLFTKKDHQGNLLISDSGSYIIKSLDTEWENKKTENDKNVVYGNLVLQVEIEEVAQFNYTEPLTEIVVNHLLGEDGKVLNQKTSL